MSLCDDIIVGTITHPCVMIKSLRDDVTVGTMPQCENVTV